MNGAMTSQIYRSDYNRLLLHKINAIHFILNRNPVLKSPLPLENTITNVHSLFFIYDLPETKKILYQAWIILIPIYMYKTKFILKCISIIVGLVEIYLICFALLPASKCSDWCMMYFWGCLMKKWHSHLMFLYWY